MVYDSDVQLDEANELQILSEPSVILDFNWLLELEEPNCANAKTDFMEQQTLLLTLLFALLVMQLDILAIYLLPTALHALGQGITLTNSDSLAAVQENMEGLQTTLAKIVESTEMLAQTILFALLALLENFFKTESEYLSETQDISLQALIASLAKLDEKIETL